MKDKAMKAVILAGGLGTRLSEETGTKPKPMVEIGGRPILWHICKIFAAGGVTDFVICLGYKGYLIKEYFANYAMHMSNMTIDLHSGDITVHKNNSEDWRVTLVDTGDATLTGGRIKRVLPYVDDGDIFCATYGDGVADINVAELIKFHRSHEKLATVTAVPPPGRFGHLEMRGDLVAGFQEKIEGQQSLINGGFFVLNKKVGDYIDGDDVMFERSPMERLAADGQLMAYKHYGFWQPMDTLRDKNALEELWEKGTAPWKIW
jgi:glucose-1-phosphate cytidylyltransferase